MTREEAAAAYDRIADELYRLNNDASAHISRRDNNWQFEIRYAMRHIANRIRTEYKDCGDYKGGGPSIIQLVNPAPEQPKEEPVTGLLKSLLLSVQTNARPTSFPTLRAEPRRKREEPRNPSDDIDDEEMRRVVGREIPPGVM